ncbi:MAG: glycosyltransferase family 2 protein [Candidatus Omnitrophica bacterium]|nr:glycosyltransferase family 2 protein [Candidatus Omnitrophota bacterium]
MAEQRIAVVIPALNEEDTIKGVLEGSARHADEIILVDDGSTDRTPEIARSMGATVITHPESEGYDKSIDDGFKLAAQNGATIIFTLDADGQHNTDDIPGLLKPILDGEADVVVGRRPRHVRIAEFIFAYMAKRKAGIDDPLCGLKAYRADVYKDIGYFDKVSSIGTQLMFNAKHKGYRIAQKDIRLNVREDAPRFGRALAANYKIARAMIKMLYLLG